MTDNQKKLIDQKDEKGLRTQISILKSGHHEHKETLISYCEEKLQRLNRSEAEVEFGEIRIGEV